MSNDDLSGRLGLDVTDFKTAIAEVNRSIRVIESGFRASAASLGDWANTASGLELRIESLTQKMDLQKIKVEALRAEYTRVAAEKGETSIAAQNLEIKLNKETETLGKMGVELAQAESALVELSSGEDDAGESADGLSDSVDSASDSSKRFGGVLDGLKSKLTAFKAGFLDLGDRVLGGVKTGLLAVTAAAAGAAAGFGAFLAKAIPAASDLGETVNKVNVIFGDASDSIVDFSETAFSALGQSQQQALDASATFGVFGKSAGLTGDDLADFSINLTGLASDLASFNNSTPQEAIDAIGAALRGESEPLRRFGVLLDDATLKAKAMELGLISSTSEALTPQQKVLAAYNVVLDQTTDAQGDFARTSSGLANASRIIQAGFANLVATLGSAFLPVVENIANFIVTNVLPVFDAFSEVFNVLIADLLAGDIGLAFDDLREGIASLGSMLGFSQESIAAFNNSLTEAFIWIRDTAIPAVLEFKDTFFGFINEVLIPFITEHAEGLKAAFIAIGAVLAGAGIAAALAAILNPINLIIVGVGLLAAAWAEDIGGIRTALTGWWEESGRPIFEALSEWLSVNLPIAIQALSDFWTGTLQPALKEVWGWINETLIPLLSDLWAWLSVNLVAAAGDLSDFWTGTLQPALKEVWAWMTGTLFPALETLGNWIGNLLTADIKFYSDLWTNTLKPALTAVWAWMTGTLFPALSDLWDWLSDSLSSATQSLSDLWTGTLQPALSIIWAFITDDLKPLFDALIELFNVGFSLALSSLSSLWSETLYPAIYDVWDVIKNSLAPIMDTLVNFWDNTFGPALEDIDFLDTLSEAFGNISGAVQDLIGFVQNLIDKLKAISPPPDFTPGSPTPFELGIRGISSAMEELSRQKIPALATGLEVLGVAGASTAGQSTVNYYNFNSSGLIDAESVRRDLRLAELLNRV